MVEISDIKDQESLKAWLLAQPEAQIKPFAIAISARVALRDVPRMWRWTLTSAQASNHDLTALPFFRCNVISGVACGAPDLMVGAAVNALSGLSPAAIPPHVEFSSSASSASCVICSFSSRDLDNFASFRGIATYVSSSVGFFSSPSTFPVTFLSSSSVTLSPSSFKCDIWGEIRNDCQGLMNVSSLENWPLWQDGEDPFAAVWDDVKSTLGTAAKDWQFWIDWYESMLHGAPQNIDMLEEIALIDDAVWKDGPEAVNAAIADIRLKYAVLATPNAEVMSINPDTGKLRVDPLTGMPRDHLQEAVEKLENVLDLFDFETAGGNQYLSLKDEWKIIDKAVQKYGQRPRMLHSACVRVERRLRIKIDAGECPEPEKDANVWDFLTTVQAVSVDLFTRDPHVKEAATHAAATKLPELDAAQIETLFKAADELAGNAEDVLQEEAPQHARDMVDPALSEGERKEAFRITASRMLRAWVLTGYRGSKAALEEVESVTKTVAGITKNIAVISTSGAVVSAPLWLGQAVDIIVKFFS